MKSPKPVNREKLAGCPQIWAKSIRSQQGLRTPARVLTCCSAVRSRWSGDSPKSSMKFEIVSQIRSVETIASGRQIRVLPQLRKKWGPGRWRKMKGFAFVRVLRSGRVREAEIHWYEAHGVGRRDFKIKRFLK